MAGYSCFFVKKTIRNNFISYQILLVGTESFISNVIVSLPRYVHSIDMSVPSPSGVRTHYQHVKAETDQRNLVDTAFSLTPNLGGVRLSQVTCSLRSRIHDAFPLEQAVSMEPAGSLLYLSQCSNSSAMCVPPCGNFGSPDSICAAFGRLIVLLCHHDHRRRCRHDEDPVTEEDLTASLVEVSFVSPFE